MFTRRDWLQQAGVGFGSLALASLLNQDAHAADRSSNPLATATPHHPAKIKSVIFLFMYGGPSHIDLFDPKPALTKYDGQAIHSIADKPAQIAPRLMGEHPEEASIEQVQAIAQAQAKLHLALQGFPLERDFNRNHQYWSEVASQLRPQLIQVDQQLLNQVFHLFTVITQAYPNRPIGFIHSDLFRDNTLFEGDQLQGILDFYELNQDEWLFDIAISINDFCTAYPQAHLDIEKAEAFLSAYQSIRPLTQDELACLDIFLAMAACRFWSMRLQVAQKNAAEGRTGEDISQKDPMEMRMMLQNRLQQVLGLG